VLGHEYSFRIYTLSFQFCSVCFVLLFVQVHIRGVFFFQFSHGTRKSVTFNDAANHVAGLVHRNG